MTAGRRRAAQAVEARRGELGLTQKQMGMDPSSYRDFVAGRSWPQARTRANIETALRWPTGEIARIAARAAAMDNDGDDPDLTELIRSDLPDEVKQRLLGRIIAAETVRESRRENGGSEASHGA